ncbi:MAG: tRNA (adenosine(37)-N6)-threonylcarbamoyltransferase complex transferase subunit TsaD [Flavobacteriales bacterium]
MSAEPIIILAIESSCDDTAAAVILNDKILANIVAGQDVHNAFGGVVPELASRAHQQNIVPVVDTALKTAKIRKEQLHAIAYTRGPGLMGSLLVGSSFAKGLAVGLGIPLIEVNHIQAHVLANFIRNDKQKPTPAYPHLCLTVSGGHTQIVLMQSIDDFQVLGSTTDDAAGEAFDKAAKILGLPYPGGPLLDKLAKTGNHHAFQFPYPKTPELNYSFSGLKTSLLYFIRDEEKKNKDFKQEHLNDICASYQHTIVSYLLMKFQKAMELYQVKSIGLAGGVSANSSLRKAFVALGETKGVESFIPPFEYCTDNAAMIAMAAYVKYGQKKWASTSDPVLARYHI